MCGDDWQDDPELVVEFQGAARPLPRDLEGLAKEMSEGVRRDWLDPIQRPEAERALADALANPDGERDHLARWLATRDKQTRFSCAPYASRRQPENWRAAPVLQWRIDVDHLARALLAAFAPKPQREEPPAPRAIPWGEPRKEATGQAEPFLDELLGGADARAADGDDFPADPARAMAGDSPAAEDEAKAPANGAGAEDKALNNLPLVGITLMDACKAIWNSQNTAQDNVQPQRRGRTSSDLTTMKNRIAARIKGKIKPLFKQRSQGGDAAFYSAVELFEIIKNYGGENIDPPAMVQYARYRQYLVEKETAPNR